jgi:hypothetical protein
VAQAEAAAETYIIRARAVPGFHAVLRCECGEGEVVIDRLASLVADARELTALMVHTVMDHESPHRVEATKVESALSLVDLDTRPRASKAVRA